MPFERKMVECPECGRTWPYVSEQGAAIELINHCIVCLCDALDSGPDVEDVRLIPRLNEDGIIELSKLRKEEAGIDIEPCPRCLHRRSPKCDLCDGLGTLFYERSDTKTAATPKGGEANE